MLLKKIQIGCFNIAREEFYQSKAWKQVRKSIWLRQHCLCARCGRAVYIRGLTDYISEEKRVKGIVHHKEYLDDVNVYDDNVALNEEKLEGLCIYCHNTEHFKSKSTRNDVLFDENGNLIKK